MDPRAQICHNLACSAYGLRGVATIRVHSRRERRYRCHVCRTTFAATADTPLYRAHVAAAEIVVVLTLLAHGCPIPAIVAALGFDERTVRAWVLRAGQHGERVHTHLIEHNGVELGVVQADELWVKVLGRRLWVAMALAVPSRLWLGGEISVHRDGRLISRLVAHVRAAARSLAVLVCVDGLPSYITAFGRAFRVPQRISLRGRPRLLPAPGFGLGQVIKRRLQKVVVEVSRRAVIGTLADLTAGLLAAGCGTALNTAYIERLNATFRACMAPLVRRGRRLLRTDDTLHAWLYLVGGTYNFCQPHRSLRVRLPVETPGPIRWQPRTPAMAAGLTDHIWSVDEWLRFTVPRPRLRHWNRRTGQISVTVAPPELLRGAA